MTSHMQNHLNMVGMCITIAITSEYQPIWQGQELADFGTDIAQGAVSETDAAKHGITPACIAPLSTAIAAYTKVMNALLKKVKTDTTAPGHRFTEAWKRPRIIVDVGGGNGGDNSSPPTPTVATLL